MKALEENRGYDHKEYNCVYQMLKPDIQITKNTASFCFFC